MASMSGREVVDRLLSETGLPPSNKNKSLNRAVDTIARELAIAEAAAVALTDDDGIVLDDVSVDDDLPVGVIVVTNGPTGTAYQRLNSDGQFHGVTGKVMTVEEMLRQPQVMQVYLPPTRG